MRRDQIKFIVIYSFVGIVLFIGMVFFLPKFRVLSEKGNFDLGSGYFKIDGAIYYNLQTDLNKYQQLPVESLSETEVRPLVVDMSKGRNWPSSNFLLGNKNVYHIEILSGINLFDVTSTSTGVVRAFKFIGANPNTFTHVVNQEPNVIDCGLDYWKDKDHVYFYRQNTEEDINDIEGADPTSFVVIPSNITVRRRGCFPGIYAIDKQHIYYNGSVIQGIDRQSFKYLGDLYARDNDHFFNRDGKVMPGNPDELEKQYKSGKLPESIGL